MKKNAQFSGCFTAMITPFKGKGIDYAALDRFVEWQIKEGIHGLVPCGTTGESPTLSHKEHKEIVARTVKLAKGRVTIMAGTGSNSTEEAVDFTRAAEKAGADAALVVAPYYNKPTQEGLYQHFKTIAKATSLPIFIYNIPGRSVVNMTDATIARLAEIPNIAGVKDATGDLARVATLRQLVGERLVLLSGEDMTMVGFNAMGGQGVISVLSNLAPKASAKIQSLTLTRQYDEARLLHAKYVNLISALFTETSPQPVKYAASLMKHGRPDVRLPLVAASETAKKQVKQALRDLKLI